MGKVFSEVGWKGFTWGVKFGGGFFVFRYLAMVGGAVMSIDDGAGARKGEVVG